MNTPNEPQNADYVRTKRGFKVHRAACPVVRRVAFPSHWEWAKGRSVDDIKAELAAVGLRYEWCDRCLPEAHNDGSGRGR